MCRLGVIRPVSSLRDVDAVFSRMIRAWTCRWRAAEGQAFVPAYVFEFDLPRVRKEDVNIEVGQHELHVSGEIIEKERVGILRHKTRRTGMFDYRVALPMGIDPDRRSR